MVHSDWGDWLPRAVAGADPDGVAVWYLGFNGLVLKAADGTTVFVDPYLGTGDPPRTIRMVPVPFDPSDVADADAVLATHEHTDHVHGPSQAPILAEAGATFYGPDDSVAVAREEDWADRWDLGEHQLAVVSEGDVFDVGGFTVHVEPAADPDAVHPVSYVLEHDGRTVFHGGDSRPAPAFEAVGERHDIDLGVLAFGSVGSLEVPAAGGRRRTRWYNDENQIVEAAADLELDRLVPSHFDAWKGLTADPAALHHHARSFEHPRAVTPVEIGDRLDV